MKDKAHSKSGWAIYMPQEVKRWYVGSQEGWFTTSGTVMDAYVFPSKKKATERAKTLGVGRRVIVVKVETTVSILFGTAEFVVGTRWNAG